MRASSADGTTYTLTIPRHALMYDTSVTLTPVASASGIPGSAPTHLTGVLLGPDGTELYESATLRVRPTAPQPEGFPAMGFEGHGSDAGLVVARPAAGGFDVRVDHFSGFVSFGPVEADWWVDVQRFRQKQAAALLEATLVDLLGIERQKMLLGLEPLSLGQLLAEVVASWDEQVLKPLVGLAPNSCRDATAAVTAYVALERLLQLLGMSLVGLGPEELKNLSPEELALRQSLHRDPSADLLTLERDLCFEEQFQRCRRTGDFEHLAQYFLAVFHQYELVGVDVPPDDIELARLYLERCGRWTLTVESLEDSKVDNGNRSVQHLIRTYLLKWEPGHADPYGIAGSRVRGEGVTEVVGATLSTPRCASIDDSYQGTEPPDTAEVTRLEFDQHGANDPTPRKVLLQLGFGTMDWSVIEHCPTGDFAYQAQTSGYLGLIIYAKDPFEHRHWLFTAGPDGEGPFHARLTILGHLPGLVATDVEATVELDHTPAP